ncbi:MAG TPA: hypothetical protein DCY70_22410 [Shewanella sp.]|nr:hypothetical protein [Shewanella sp.]
MGSDRLCKKDLQVKGLSVISRKFDTQGQKGITGTMQDASRRMDGAGSTNRAGRLTKDKWGAL